VVAYVNMCSYYVIGVPLGVVLAYVAKLEIQVRRPEPASVFRWEPDCHLCYIFGLMGRHFTIQRILSQDKLFLGF